MQMMTSKPTNRRSGLALIAAALCAPGWLRAQTAAVTVEGFSFEPLVQLGQTELVLNGAGLRAVAWIKGYAAALYLVRKAGTPAQVLALPGPKRLQMRMLLEVPAAEFVKAIDTGIARNTPAAELPALRERIQRFDAQVAAAGTVKKGDLVDLDFVPAQGMSFALNGIARGAPIPGDDFYAAVLRIFIGDKPVDKGLKAGLLGGRKT